MAKVALTTGCSSGIGYETALELARAGFVSYATMRDTSAAGPLLEAAGKEGLDVRAGRLDVDDAASAEAAVSRAESESGGLDVLVNNAGYGLCGCLEDVAMDDLRAQFETNFFGAVRMIQLAAPLMRRRGSGHVINVSSVAGRMGFPATPAYVSSKFALEGLSECLRYEMGPMGIRVVAVEPGVVKTRFFDSMRQAEPRPGSPYAEMARGVVEGVRMMVGMGTDPAEVARTVARAALDDDPDPRYVVGNDAAMFMDARRSRTDREFEEYVRSQVLGR